MRQLPHILGSMNATQTYAPVNSSAQPRVQAVLQGINLVMDYNATSASQQTSRNTNANSPMPPMPMMQPLALNHVNFQIGEGERVAIMGPSGSGKSTLLHVLAGITKPTAGQVLFRGTDVDHISDAERTKLRRQAFGFVFQSGQLLPELPAIENVALPLMLGGMPYAQATDQAAVWLERMGLRNLLRNRPGQMSGGQMQRVAIARALVNDPAIILADEPTGNLDSTTGRQVLDTFHALKRAGKTIVLITHDPGVAAEADRAVQIRDGRIYQGAYVPIEPGDRSTAVERGGRGVPDERGNQDVPDERGDRGSSLRPLTTPSRPLEGPSNPIGGPR